MARKKTCENLTIRWDMVLGMVWIIPDADTLRHQFLGSTLAWGLARKHGSLQCSVQHGPWKAQRRNGVGSHCSKCGIFCSKAPNMLGEWLAEWLLRHFREGISGRVSRLPKDCWWHPKFWFMKTQVHPKFRSECSLRILHIFWTSPFPSDVTVFRYRNFRSFPKGYLAGVTVDALVQLRDQFGNNRTSSSPTLLFQALVEGELQRD